jgi:hypothetical protein
MAGEIQLQVSILRRPPTTPNKERRFGPYVLTTDQTGNGVDDRTYSVGTSEETITFTDFTNSGLVGIANEDSTNYVELGFATTVYPIRLLKNEAYVFRLNPSTTTLYVKANTAACEVRVFGVES